MTDRELLEAAARAAGIELIDYCTKVVICYYSKQTQSPWNPLTDDGDALRLAVKLLLTIQQRDDHVKVGWQGCVEWIGEEWVPCDEACRGKATRRAIVRAAAATAPKEQT